ncbi:unnamed protein product [Lymnaea stagnalis]|uniref:Rho-GAP domain-containing protein n=1 Tax=Lymnaea stagnalis TaxID=6523 RepID=A0AAV2IHM1_LYMST
MVKMLLLLSLRGVNNPVKRLVTSAGCCKKELASCADDKNFKSRPGGLQQEIYKQWFSDKVLARRTLSQSQAENVWKSLKLISSTLLNSRIQVEANDKISSNDVKMETDTNNSLADSNFHLLECLEISKAHTLNEIKKVAEIPSFSNWLPNYNQKGRLLGGLFNNGRKDALTYLNQSLGPLSYNCRWLHLVPARYCNIPTTFNDIAILDQRLGTTYVSQLCTESQNRLKEIAHEHLKKALRANKVNVVKDKPKEYPDEGLFKSPLLTQVKKDKRFKKASLRVPAILRYMTMEIHTRNLDTPGLFRVSGDPDKVQKLKSDLEQNFYGTEGIDSSGYDIHDFATLLKDYLRELPTRLVSTEKFEIFPDIEDLDFEKEQFPIMNFFHLSMTDEHRKTLQYLLSFLGEVSRHSPKNQMDADKLAVVFGPLLFKMADMPAKDMAEKVSCQVNMTRAWMFYYPILALVPFDMMEELRKSFSSKPATISFDPKVFGLEVPKTPSVPKKLESLTDATITVLTPYEAQPSKEIKIGATHTAQQVVCEILGIPLDPFDIAPSDTSSDKTTPLNPVPLHDFNTELGQGDAKPLQYLYEVGGNIGERCLNPNTKMLDLYKGNPKAFWVVKTQGSPPVHRPIRRVTFKLK